MQLRRARVGQWTAAEPLHRRVPTRDESGRLLGDFMMLLPGLRELPQGQLTEALARIEYVLKQFHEVVFVDLNVKLNLLWISVRPRPGIVFDVAGALRFELPRALLVTQRVSWAQEIK